MGATKPRRRDASRNRALIVEAAREALTASEHPSLEEIAEIAGVGVATLYRHFASREALEREVYRVIFAAEVEPLLAHVDYDEPRRSFIDVAEGLLEVIGRHQHMLVGVVTNLPEVAGDLLEEFIGPFAEMLRQGQWRGELRGDLEVADILWLLQILVTGLSVPAATANIRRRYLSLMFDALRPGSEEPLPPFDGGDAD